ncbi:MAG: nicotinate-nucleotide adenylyltransferase [Xanthomonadales bacterium]
MTRSTPAVGIFGGTFDPVHYGHLRAALEAMEMLRLQDFRLLPAGTPPHRANTFASADDRLAMLKLALYRYPELQVDDREVRREGSSFMVDTLSEIRREEGDAPILMMIGQDAANVLDQWHEWHRLFDLAHLVIMRRPISKEIYSAALFEQVQPRLVNDPGQLQNSPAGLILPLEVTQLAISSTAIRRQIRAGLSPRFLLPDPVIDYIFEHGLY